mgnify:CR=1 FL=1
MRGLLSKRSRSCARCRLAQRRVARCLDVYQRTHAPSRARVVFATSESEAGTPLRGISRAAPALPDGRRRLPAGRFARPATWEQATPEQQAYVRGILSGPRNAISGPLAAMIASPELGDVAQRTMAYARFAGTEGAGSVPPRLQPESARATIAPSVSKTACAQGFIFSDSLPGRSDS